MVNLRTITQKVTKDEAKDLLDKAQDIINKDILGPNFKREKLLSTKDGKKKKVKIDGEERELIDGELNAVVKVKKTKVPKAKKVIVLNPIIEGFIMLPIFKNKKIKTN